MADTKSKSIVGKVCKLGLKKLLPLWSRTCVLWNCYIELLNDVIYKNSS